MCIRDYWYRLNLILWLHFTLVLIFDTSPLHQKNIAHFKRSLDDLKIIISLFLLRFSLNLWDTLYTRIKDNNIQCGVKLWNCSEYSKNFQFFLIFILTLNYKLKFNLLFIEKKTSGQRTVKTKPVKIILHSSHLK